MLKREQGWDLEGEADGVWKAVDDRISGTKK